MKALTRKDFLEFMQLIMACRGSRAWVYRTPGSPKELWRKCGRSNWLKFVMCRISTVRFRDLVPFSETDALEAEREAQVQRIYEHSRAERYAKTDAYAVKTGLSFYGSTPGPGHAELRYELDLAEDRVRRAVQKIDREFEVKMCAFIRKALPWEVVKAGILTYLGKM
jgi:hypothetical protein